MSCMLFHRRPMQFLFCKRYLTRLSIFVILGFPEFLLNSTMLDEFHGDLIMESNDYIMNNVRLEEFYFRKKMLKLGQLIDKTE